MYQDKSKPIYILHVEDEKGALEITRFFLKKTGYDNFQITPSLSAIDALEKLKQESFDIIISDYKMPGMDGIEFLKKIREMNLNLPFILFTGKGKDETQSEALNLGANKYLKKEGAPNILFDKLGRYINEEVELHFKRMHDDTISQFEGIDEIRPMIIALNDKDWTVRKNASESIGNLGNIHAIPYLIEIIDDVDEDVRVSVIKALGSLILKMQEEAHLEKTKLIKLLITKLIELLINSLGDNKKIVRSASSDTIIQIGENAVNSLINHIQSDSEYIRLGVIWILGELRDKKSIVPLLKVLKSDSDPYIRWSASEALTKFNSDEKIIDYLIYYLKDTSEFVRWHATEILGTIKTKKSTIPLIDSINDESEFVQIGAIWALGEIQDEYSIDYLIDAFAINNRKVQEEIVKSLSKFGKVVNKPLLSALKSKNQEIRIGAALTLSKIGDEEALDSIISTFKKGKDEEKLMAAKSLKLISKHSKKKMIEDIQQEVDNYLQPFIERDRELEYINKILFDTILTKEKIDYIRELRAIGYTELQISNKTKTPLRTVIRYLSEGIEKHESETQYFKNLKRKRI